MAKNNEINKKLQFQRLVISCLFVIFVVLLILSFITKEIWAVTGAMVSIFVLVDYLFIVTVFNGNASNKIKK